MKEKVAQEIARRVKDGDVIGVGTGTTVDAALTEIGKRVQQEGLRLTVVPTSLQSAWRCQELGLTVLYQAFNGHLSWGFDGADQVTKERWAIKGKGGAMLQEKILAKRCKKFIIIVDDTKVVSQLGAGCPVPVEVIPEARIRIAHGQMRERELEYVMRDFYQQRFNLLLCTTIIETGIDVPSANTIIIDRADRFGLAQLHQLRGRVGRSHHQAYAYLLTHDEAPVSADARKRLEAIQMMEELGSGFYLAMHDLEIRGAGEVLGDSQSGEMQEIGFGMYTEMLSSAVRSLRAGKEPDLDAPLAITTEINLHATAVLPENYCADVHERLVLYKRLANCESLDEIEALSEELVDRFGVLPEAASTLVDTHRLRILSKPLGVMRIDAGANAVQIQFIPNPPVDPQRVIALVRSRPGHRLTGSEKLRIDVPLATTGERVELLRKTLQALQ